MTSIDNRITPFCQIKMEVFIKLKVVSNAIDFKLFGDRPFALLILVCVCGRDLWPLKLVTAEQTTGFITTNVSPKFRGITIVICCVLY